MSSELTESIVTVREFLAGTGGPYDWGELLNLPVKEPEVAELQGFCRQLPQDYPPEDPVDYCSRKGMERLAEFVNELERREHGIS